MRPARPASATPAAYTADAVVSLDEGTGRAHPSTRACPLDAGPSRAVGCTRRTLRARRHRPLSVTTARQMLADARVDTMLRDCDAIIQVSSTTRTIPAKLRRWLEETYP